MANFFPCLVRPVTRTHDDSNHTLIATFDSIDIVEGTFWTRTCLQTINSLNTVFSTRNRVVVGFEGFLIRCTFFNRYNWLVGVLENFRILLDKVIGHDGQITCSRLVGLVDIIALGVVVAFEGNSNSARSIVPFGMGHSQLFRLLIHLINPFIWIIIGQIIG